MEKFQFSGMGLKFLRIIHGYEAKDFAARLGVSNSLVSIIEAGTHKMSTRDTRNTLELFGMTEAQAIQFIEIIETVKGGRDNGGK
ncbi:helix-turn-helix transcriptional regulator [Peribacillus frigoritolerans]|uniref:Helix-turn-helix transcriptional regulator n=1 Tax=Peribacillus frigoritolerans TaxID=450367 RepID=A0AAJ1VAE6_9BACI|nr:helix-turn-helix transcriptional regulator [Peribacillus frigoritolerans]MDM5283107.1 helix-turn-helix transcriptional regulator [Peribacillus frigoritolerans]